MASSSPLPDSGGRSSQFSVTRDKFRLKFALWVSVSVFAAAVVVISAIVFVGWRWPAKQKAQGEKGSPFCCPEDMRETLRYINTSANPCRDFFAYVCSGVISNRLWPEDNSQAEFERMVFTGVMPPGTPRSPAGEFLVEFRRSCLQSIARENFTSALAIALVRREQVFLKNMDAKKAFIYAARSILQYRLNAAFYVLLRLNNQTVKVGIRLNCSNDDSHARNALTVSLSAINNALPVPVTEEKILDLKANICRIYHANREGIVMYTTTNRSDFQRDVWDIDDLEAGLVANGLTLATVQFLTVKRSRTIRAFLEIFSRERSEGPTGAAFLLWHSVTNGARMFQATSEMTPQRLFEVCKKQINSVWQLALMFMVDIFTSPAKDAKLRVIFDNVKDAVRADLLKSGLVAPDDQNRLEHFFRDLALLTPAEVIDTNVPVPNVSRDFASNLLNAFAFDFESTKAFFAHFNERQLRSFLHLIINGNLSVFLNTNFYNIVKAGDAHLELSNMASVGRVLAEALWFMVFRMVTWTPQTLANMLRLEECYDSFYWSNSSRMNPNEITSFFTALGLSSVLNAFYRPQWLTVKPAWSFWRMSHSQLFYILSTYSRCPRTSTARDVNLINAPLKYIVDFQDAFQCPPGTPMTKRDSCSQPAHGSNNTYL